MSEDMNDQVAQEEVDQLELEIQNAFSDAVEAGKSEDEVKLAMIAAGATFKNVTRLYNKFMIDAGLAISKSDRDAAVASIVGDPAMLADEEYYNYCVTEIVGQIKGATERAAGAMLRAFAKANEVECFKKAKAEGTGTRQKQFRTNVYNLFIENPDLTEAELDAYAEDSEKSGSSENDRKQLSHYHGLRRMVNEVAKAIRAR